MLCLKFNDRNVEGWKAEWFARSNRLRTRDQQDRVLFLTDVNRRLQIWAKSWLAFVFNISGDDNVIGCAIDPSDHSIALS